MRRLSTRHRGGQFYEVGPAGHGPGLTVTVKAQDRRQALRKGKAELKAKGQLIAAGIASYRQEANGVDTRWGQENPRRRIPRGGKA